MLWLNIAISILACIVLYTLPLNTVIKHSVSIPNGIDSSIFSYCFLVGFLIFFIKNLILVLTAVLKGHEKYGTVAIFNNLTLIIYFVTLIVIATFGYEIKTILISGSIVYLMALLGMFFFIFFYSNYVHLNFLFSKRLFKRLTNFSFYSWLQTLAAIAFSQIDRFLIISNLGINSFSFYSISIQLAQTPHSLTGGALNFIFPRVSFQYQTRNDNLLLKNYYKVLLYSFLFSFSIFILLYLFRYDLTRLWINKDFANDTYKSTGYLLIAYLFMSFTVVPHYFLYGLGEIKFVSLINIISMIFSIITFIILIPIFGLNGAIIGRFMYLPLLIINHFKVIKILKK
jgi:O-antigen/teichoic acid export membrane protein